MEFSNDKTIKSFATTGSKYTVNNSENVKDSIFLTERFMIKESVAVSYPTFLSVHQGRAKETGLGAKVELFSMLNLLLSPLSEYQLRGG